VLGIVCIVAASFLFENPLHKWHLPRLFVALCAFFNTARDPARALAADVGNPACPAAAAHAAGVVS